MENIVSYTSGGKNYPVATDVEAVSFSKLGLSSTEGLIDRYNMNEVLKGTGREIIDCEDAVRILEERLEKTLSVGSQVEWTNKRTSEYFRYEKVNESEWNRCDFGFLQKYYGPSLSSLEVKLEVTPKIIPIGTEQEIKFQKIARIKREDGTYEKLNDLFKFYQNPNPFPETIRLEANEEKDFIMEYESNLLGIPRRRVVTTVKPGYPLFTAKVSTGNNPNDVIKNGLGDKIQNGKNDVFGFYNIEELDTSINLDLENEYIIVAFIRPIEGFIDENGINWIDSFNHSMGNDSNSQYQHIYILRDPVTIHNKRFKIR